MVFFTCNKCGDSLKKKDVEKHTNFSRCNGPPFLTCVDCLKDFREDYAKHIVCVSENDRYSSSGLKGIEKKPKSKQQIWVETVQDCVSRAIDGGEPNLTPSIRSLMLFLQEQPTLPDKQKPLTNFIQNARRGEPIQNIEFVWRILEKGRNDLQAKLKAEREAAEAEKRKKKEQEMQAKSGDSSESSSDDSDSSDADNTNETKKKKGALEGNDSKIDQAEGDEGDKVMNGKKDKKKKKRMVSESESINNGTSESQKTKKSKKNPIEETEEMGNDSKLNNALDACHLDSKAYAEEGQKLSKKEKKEKKKREKYEAEIQQMETAETVDEDLEAVEEAPQKEVEEINGKKEKKKKKGKKNDVEISGDGVEKSENGEKKKKEKKNKKRQLQEEEDAIIEQSNPKDMDKKKVRNSKSESGTLNEDLDVEEESNRKFSWDTAILQVLESQSDKEISLKRLSKKVVGEYLMSLGENAHIDEMKIVNKFHKRLEKMHNVLIHKDKVRLKTSRD